MAKKPDAARGKKTRKGSLKRAARDIKKILTGLKTRQARSKPGATDSATRLKLEKSPRKRLMRAATPKLRNVAGARPQRDRTRGIAPGTKNLMKEASKSAIKGAGASGAAMAGQAFKLAKKLKPEGRLNMNDIKRAKQMMSKRKGK